MDVLVKKSETKGFVHVPPSKSVAHRLMIAAMLARKKLYVSGDGEDIRATEECINILLSSPHCNKDCYAKNSSFCLGDCSRCDSKFVDTSEEITYNNSPFWQENTFPTPILNARESGSTLRFLLPIICALGLDVVVTGEGRLKDRPLGELVEALNSNGAHIERIGSEQLPLRVSGKLRAGRYEIDGRISSQYITGLLFALPLLDGDSELVVRGELVSANYVYITLGVLAEFGIRISKTKDGFYIKGAQYYLMPESLKPKRGIFTYVEGDWSSAAFLLALGVLTGEVSVRGLKEESLQGDKVVLDLLRRAGANIDVSKEKHVEGDRVVAKKSELRAIAFDARHCPDVVPIMAVVLSFAKGVSYISSVDRLRAKESDRLRAIRALLADFGIKTEYGDDVLAIYGGEHRACHTHGFNDHRMAMSAIVLAIATDGVSRIDGVECMSKSYPKFIEEVMGMGANIKEL